MNALNVENLPLESLLPYARNSRTHSREQVRQIARSIREFGFLVPVLIDREGTIIAGHGRVLAAKQIGLERIPALRVEHLTEAQVKAYRIADNRIALNAGWDESLLRIEIQELISVDVDPIVLGFPQGELDVLISDRDDAEEPPLPSPPSPDETVTQPGDIWLLGEHRVLCGDCRDSAAVAQLMQGEWARMVITDAPYNVRIDGHVSGLGQHKHAEFQMASGEMSSEEFVRFLVETVGIASSVCVDGALLYLFIDWRHLPELYAACAQLKLSPVNLAVWSKTGAGMGSLYRSQHELVLIVKKGSAPHINNVQLGKHGRYRSNVWTYAGQNTFGAARDEALAAHPTVKPTALIRDAILDVTNFGDVVFDGFLGSGTAVLAAEQARRRCFGIEIEPRYVDVTLLRWIAATGQQPVHLRSGETFAVRRERVAAEVA